MDFYANRQEQLRKLQEKADYAVAAAKKAGADECAVTLGGGHGISVSARDGDIENVEFNNDQGMEITVYKNKCTGSTSTSDLSQNAIDECVRTALALAGYADSDPCAGICDKDLLCHEEHDLGLLYENLDDADEAKRRVTELDRLAIDVGAKDSLVSDGSNFYSSYFVRVIADSNGFSGAAADSLAGSYVTLIGTDGSGKKQNATGFSVSRDYRALPAFETVVAEARERTLGKLNARPVPTGRYNVIFSRGAARSLWNILLRSIRGALIYRHASFMCDMLNTPVLPDFLTVNEDPWMRGGFASRNYDSEGAAAVPGKIVEDGVLRMYLLGCYSARQLGMRSNGHAGGTGNIFIQADDAHTLTLDEMLAQSGEGVVVESLMGQGVNLVSGNYSQGASGYFYKNGRREHAVEEITIAGNLREMLLNIALIGTDIDTRYSMHTGSVLIPDMAVSGS